MVKRRVALLVAFLGVLLNKLINSIGGNAMNRRTFYIYKGYDQTKTIAIICPNVGKERAVAEMKRLNKKHGHITVRNCLGGLISEVLDNGKINSFIKQEEIK